MTYEEILYNAAFVDPEELDDSYNYAEEAAIERYYNNKYND